ncbi:hypothetical protein ACNKHW_17865 [Shigella flexneri]
MFLGILLQAMQQFYRYEHIIMYYAPRIFENGSSDHRTNR